MSVYGRGVSVMARPARAPGRPWRGGSRRLPAPPQARPSRTCRRAAGRSRPPCARPCTISRCRRWWDSAPGLSRDRAACTASTCGRSGAAPSSPAVAEWWPRSSLGPGAARTPGRIHVRGVGTVAEVPENLGLADERGHATRLQLVRRAVAYHDVHRLLGVPAGPRQSRTKVGQHLRAHPRIVPLPGQNALGQEVGSKELRERGGHRLDQASLADQLDVGVAREAPPGEDRAVARHLLAVEANAVGQSQPELESPLARLGAVVIVNPADPHPAEGRVFRLRDDDRVLDGNARLVVVTIQYPLLELHLRQLAVVHQPVIAVVVVITLLALAPDPGDEFVLRQRGSGRGHRLTSMPS